MSLCTTVSENNINQALPGHMCIKNLNLKEASLCTFQRGSFTIEAAVVIPIVAGFLVCILFFFRMLQVQAAVDEALCYAGRKVAVESSITESEAALFLSAELFFYQIIDEYECVEKYVENGNFGISLLKSDFSGEDISLRAEYSMKLPVSFFELGRVYLWQQNTFRKWTGDGGTNEQKWVYVSATGTVYHKTMDCRSIRVSVRQTAYSNIEGLRGKNGQKYYPCSSCVEEVLNQEIVYYTDYGVLYHKDISCSPLKRTVTRIPLSEVGNRTECRFCYQD